MMRSRALRAFTLAELLIGMVGSSIVIGALLFSSVQLQKSLHASESYAASQADQRRLLDSLSRDVRRAIGIASTTTMGGAGGAPLAGESVKIENSTSLVLTQPGYYQSDAPEDRNYDQVLPVVAADNFVDYGTKEGHAPGVRVIFRKQYIEEEKCVCFIRLEAEAQSIIVRQAENLHLQVGVAPDGRTCHVEVTFVSPRYRSETLISMRDQILLRNIRLD
jgi:hypothetical protein